MLKTNSSKDGFRPMGPWLMSRTKTEGNAAFPGFGLQSGDEQSVGQISRTGEQPFRSSGSSAGKATLGYSIMYSMTSSTAEGGAGLDMPRLPGVPAACDLRTSGICLRPNPLDG